MNTNTNTNTGPDRELLQLVYLASGALLEADLDFECEFGEIAPVASLAAHKAAAVILSRDVGAYGTDAADELAQELIERFDASGAADVLPPFVADA